MQIHMVHEYGAKRHMLPLRALERRGDVRFRYTTWPSSRRLLRALARRERSAVDAWAQDAAGYFRQLADLDDVTLLGLAPFSTRLLAMRWAARNTVLHTSWPHWQLDQAVHNPGNRLLASHWIRFVRRVRTVAVTKSVASEIRRIGGNPVVIPHAVDTEIFTPLEVSREPPRNTVVVFAGRLIPSKGIEDILLAAEKLKSESIEWRILGDGPMRHDLEAAARLNPKLHVRGHLSGRSYVEALQEADVLILPSYRDGAWEELFGIVLIEAFACGVPVIVSDCVGPAEIVARDELGWVIPQRDPEALITSVMDVHANTGQLASMRLAVRKEAEARYSIGRVAEQWLEVLEAVVAP